MILYLSEKNTQYFQENKNKIKIVCLGDSITGYNNTENKIPTYPRFLEKLTDLNIADCGISGEISTNAFERTKESLDSFPNAEYFILGYGTNDFGKSVFIERTSNAIIYNLNRSIDFLLEKKKIPFLINLTYLGEDLFSREFYEKIKEQRDYHNQKLKEYCSNKQISLIDICSKITSKHLEDGLHPNEQGARLIAKQIHNSINK